ncbi:MAG TPA: hypothetical protein VNC50_09185, partial [Planctomycetia bacterium]|nr:hypothetical protein [Planctomycetia bacterium]
EARGAGGGALQKPTRTAIDNRKWASEEFARQLAALKGLDGKLKTIEAALDKAGAPSTPGRLPDWKGE